LRIAIIAECEPTRQHCTLLISDGRLVAVGSINVAGGLSGSMTRPR
jgi:hypothetical protein